MIDENLKQAVFRDIALLSSVGAHPIVVHGGGPEINQWLTKLDIKSEFRDGLRVTNSDTMEIVEMVLSGSINKEIVMEINKKGGRAIGLSPNKNLAAVTIGAVSGSFLLSASIVYGLGVIAILAPIQVAVAVLFLGFLVAIAFMYQHWDDISMDEVTQTLGLHKEGIIPHIQVHDELDISVESPEHAEKIKDIMESAVDLEVPNKVDYEYGPNWGQIK